MPFFAQKHLDNIIYIINSLLFIVYAVLCRIMLLILESAHLQLQLFLQDSETLVLGIVVNLYYFGLFSSHMPHIYAYHFLLEYVQVPSSFVLFQIQLAQAARIAENQDYLLFFQTFYLSQIRRIWCCWGRCNCPIISRSVAA